MSETLMGIRQVGQSVDDLGSAHPELSQEIQQIKSILRQMILKSAQAASLQTASAEALPMAGS